MQFDAILVAPRRDRNVSAGHWRNQTINDALDACLRERPTQLALTAHRIESGELTRFNYAELARMADRMAVGLHKLGVRQHDVVSCQLPNWWQFTLLYLACARIGAVLNPLMPIFRERELGFMLGHGESKVMLCPRPSVALTTPACCRTCGPICRISSTCWSSAARARSPSRPR